MTASDVSEEDVERYALSVVLNGKGVRCVYINDFRLVGSKPYYTENLPTVDFTFPLDELQRAFPTLEIRTKKSAALSAVSQDGKLREALEGWLDYAEEHLGEFAIEDPAECDGDNLCPRCRVTGCIALKIADTRAALSQVKEN